MKTVTIYENQLLSLLKYFLHTAVIILHLKQLVSFNFNSATSNKKPTRFVSCLFRSVACQILQIIFHLLPKYLVQLYLCVYF